MNIKDNKKNYHGGRVAPTQRGGPGQSGLGNINNLNNMNNFNNFNNISVPNPARKQPQGEYYERNFSKEFPGFQV
jgi:hypothetical protein